MNLNDTLFSSLNLTNTLLQTNWNLSQKIKKDQNTKQTQRARGFFQKRSIEFFESVVELHLRCPWKGDSFKSSLWTLVLWLDAGNARSASRRPEFHPSSIFRSRIAKVFEPRRTSNTDIGIPKHVLMRGRQGKCP